MVGRLLARYTTSDVGADQARVAGFHMNITADSGNTLPLGIGLEYQAGDLTSQKVDFTVSGSTEVALEYGLQVELTHADGTALTQEQWCNIRPKIAPLTSGIPESEVAGTAGATGSAASCVYTFSGTENVAPTDNYNQNYRLTFGSTETGSYTDGFRVEIYIDGQQVD